MKRKYLTDVYWSKVLNNVSKELSSKSNFGIVSELLLGGSSIGCVWTVDLTRLCQSKVCLVECICSGRFSSWEMRGGAESSSSSDFLSSQVDQEIGVDCFIGEDLLNQEGIAL